MKLASKCWSSKGTKKNLFNIGDGKQACDLFAIVLDYAQLRHRVGDHTVFGICHLELLSIQQAINKMISDLIADSLTPPQDNVLLEKIDRFEEIYQNVLRVTAPDPLVFVLFIDSLKMFGGNMKYVSF